jgi:uncharacterized membrane protein
MAATPRSTSKRRVDAGTGTGAAGARPWWWGPSQRRRVIESALVGLVAGGVAATLGPWQLATLVGWDVAALLTVVRVWARLHRATSELLLLGASIVSLAGVAAGLIRARDAARPLEPILTVAAVLAVASSWLVVHCVFTLRYANEYYGDPVGGIDFHSGEIDPDYRDFAYLGFTVGMTFQVSDTEINSPAIRRIVLHHALISYLFGAVILAVTVNVIATLLSSSS